VPPESPSLRQVLLVYERVRALSGRLYAQVINQYWQRLQLLTGDGAIAIHIAAQFNPLVFPLSVMDFTSRTLGEAMPRAFEYFNSANPHTRYSSNAQSDRIYLKVAYPRDLGLLHFDAEWRADPESASKPGVFNTLSIGSTRFYCFEQRCDS